MTTKLGLLKQAAFAVCCAASAGAMPLAHADNFGVSVATGPGYYNAGYNRPVRHAQRCFRNRFGAVHCRVVRSAGYYNGPSYYNRSAYYNGPAYNNGSAHTNGSAYYNGSGYYNGSNHGSGVSLNYYGGSNHRDRDRTGWRDRDDRRRHDNWRDRDHDRDHDGDHDGDRRLR